IKARAAANPVAALAIGAGLAWRFAHRPPIATLLVGAGLVALFKTNPQERHMGADFVERAGEFAGTVKETVSEKIDELSHSELAARASELSGTVAAKASELGGTVRQKAGEMSGTVKETVGQWSARTGEFASEAAAEASSAANSLARDSRRVAAAVNQDRDTYLLGAAAIALAAAVGISYQRSAN
ncbi:MAG TPA: hypothetical protein VKC16_11765, partial [Xanthobacteraceae bacterium]|nr:hypothetical protein [Xanthobacteraceae bacterium]